MKRLMTGTIACALGIAAYAVCGAQDAAPKAAEKKASEPQAVVEQKAPAAVCEQTCIMRKMDANGDGQISQAECIACRETWFKEMDADKDGKLSADEINAGADKDFAAMDADKDGAVTVEEYIIFFAGKDAPKDQPAAAACGDKKCIFEKQDANNDSMITVGEIVVYRTAQFKDLDANGDGKVTADELKANRAKWSSTMDADKCGALTKDDFMSACMPKAVEKKVEDKPADKPAEKPAAQ